MSRCPSDIKAKEQARRQYLRSAIRDVNQGMEPGAFHDKYSMHPQFIEGDWLLIRNYFLTSEAKGKR